ncbi:MAG: hypothetical protein M1836_006476 [Candelina mexicana]|nr:MAG: hypothetical protein M1836_006476 [Candelina mexicana]
MSVKVPYTYISCPCTDNTKSSSGSSKRRSWAPGQATGPENDTEEEKTFDPKAPRSAYSLWPIEHLLYCEDCHQIRCPRCVLEEISMWWCPSCYFEVPNSVVKTDGNRCQRNCYQCPICTTQLNVNALDTDTNKLGGPYVLGCPYCYWSSLDIGVQFDKPTNITGQLAKRTKPEDDDFRRTDLIPSQQTKDDDSETEGSALEANEQFANLKSFYSTQITNSSPNPLPGFSDLGGPSPGSTSRLLAFYSQLAGYGKKKPKEKLPLMREAYNIEEGLKVLGDEDDHIIEKMKNVGWEGTTSLKQRSEQPHEARFLSRDIRPIPTLLRTKRSKRCRACRHILAKQENKMTSIRYRIRLLASTYIPTLSLLPFHPDSNLPAPTPPGTKPPLPRAPTYLAATTLTPLKPTQYLLTVTNNLFAPISVNLATPSHTPGRFPSKVTILCPSFEVAPNKDAWEEALGTPDKKNGGGGGMGMGMGRSVSSAVLLKKAGGEGEAEAGKIWAKGKNWTSVVVEIVPGSLESRHQRLLSRADASSPARGGGGGGAGGGFGGDGASGGFGGEGRDSKGEREWEVEEDDDVVEIPVFVHVEYVDDEGDITRGPGEKKAEEVEGGVRRELAFWCVLGVGKIRRESGGGDGG